MKSPFFQLPEVLNANLPQIAAVQQNNILSNIVLEYPDPISVPNSADLGTSFELVESTINTNFANARTTADVWEGSVSPKVTDLLNSFTHFNAHFQNDYAQVVLAAANHQEDAVHTALTRIQQGVQATVSLLTASGTKTATANYLASVTTNQAAFNKDYASVIAEVDHVSATIGQLNDSIASLHSDVEANNRAVLSTVVDTSGKVLVQGATVATSAATDNPAGAVVAGVTGIADGADGLTKVVQLNQQTVDDLVQIRKLATEVGQDEIALMILVGIGTTLSSLGGTQGLQLDIVGNVFDYWSALDDGIQYLFDKHGKDLSGQIDLVNFSPITEKYKNPAYPPFNVIDPVAQAANVFDAVLATSPQFFGAGDTKFVAIQA